MRVTGLSNNLNYFAVTSRMDEWVIQRASCPNKVSVERNVRGPLFHGLLLRPQPRAVLQLRTCLLTFFLFPPSHSFSLFSFPFLFILPISPFLFHLLVPSLPRVFLPPFLFHFSFPFFPKSHRHLGKHIISSTFICTYLIYMCIYIYIKDKVFSPPPIRCEHFLLSQHFEPVMPLIILCHIIFLSLLYYISLRKRLFYSFLFPPFYSA